MLDQTTDELFGADGSLVDAIIVQLVAVEKPHMTVIKPQDAAVPGITAWSILLRCKELIGFCGYSKVSRSGI